MGQAFALCSNNDTCHECVERVDSCAALVARHLLEAEAPFGAMETANCSLIRASKDGDISSMLRALEAGADVNTRLPMWIRMRSMSNSSVVNMKGVDGEAVELIDREDSAQPMAVGLTPLMYASCEGRVDAVKLLLSLRADMDICDEDGMQAIHMAAEAASPECFRVLMEEGADPLVKDDLGRDAFQCVPLSVITCNSTKQPWTKLLQANEISALVAAGVSEGEMHESGCKAVAAVVGASNDALLHGGTRDKDLATTTALSGQEHNEAEEDTPHFEGDHFELTSCVRSKREVSICSYSTSATVDHEVGTGLL